MSTSPDSVHPQCFVQVEEMAISVHKACAPLQTIKLLFCMRFNATDKIIGPHGLALVMLKQETVAALANKQLS